MNALTPTRWERIQASALAHLADDEAAVIDYAAELRRDRDTFKALALELMGALHEQTKIVQRQQETIIRLHALVREYVTSAAPGRERRAA